MFQENTVTFKTSTGTDISKHIRGTALEVGQQPQFTYYIISLRVIA
jgi:hypothetical protein